MAIDNRLNFSYSTVATAPSPATSGTSLVVASGDGAIFPAVSFNAVIWPAGEQPTTTNAEIVRVTNVSTDTFTIDREEESTSARTVVIGDQIMAGVTKKMIDDIETDIATKVTGPGSATDAVPALFDGTNGKLIKNSTPTGTGNPVLATSPTLVTPALGTPASGVMTNMTGLTNAGLATATGAPGGAWNSWAVTYTNLTKGSGTENSAYIQIGKMVYGRIAWAFGAGSSVGASAVTFNLPVTAASGKFIGYCGNCYFENSGVLGYVGQIALTSTTVGQMIYYLGVSGTVNPSGISTNAPFTWGTGDFFSGYFFYEAA